MHSNIFELKSKLNHEGFISPGFRQKPSQIFCQQYSFSRQRGKQLNSTLAFFKALWSPPLTEGLCKPRSQCSAWPLHPCCGPFLFLTVTIHRKQAYLYLAKNSLLPLVICLYRVNHLRKKGFQLFNLK